MATAIQQFSGIFEADVDHSSFDAGTRHMGVGSFRTRFEDVSARLTAGDAGLRLEGEARVDSVSIRKPPEFREHVVNGADFFDAGRFPAIGFASTDIELSEDGGATVRGALTIKGTTRDVTATGTYRAPTEDPYGSLRAALDVSASIDRRDFGIDWQAQLPKGGNVLEWDVEIAVHIELVQAG